MPAVIYTNQASLMAQKGLLGAQTSLALSVERLSSGLRINRAKDDAAGLGVGENLQKQLNGVRQGLNNVNDAISMSQTAEGALSAVAAVTQRMITLATQGANDTMSQDQRASIAKEIDKLRTSIQDMAKRTKYTDTTLFSGVSQFIQVSNNAADKITISTSALAAISVDATVTNTFSSGGVSGATSMVLGAVTGISVGQTITGTGVTANTTVTAVDSGTKTITLSNALTAQAAGTYSFNMGATASDSGSALNSKINVLKTEADKAASGTSAITSKMFTDIQTTAASYLVVITAQRGELGAVQNQLEYTISNLTEFANNLAAARSRVMDTDYASETANLTKGQILQQAATAMLAQANQMPNVILSLLK
jgi:flagellin